jgi:CxxC motif-containing protein (DUF1111 family)
MNKSHRVWYLVIALLALAPVGLRVLTWQRHRHQEVDPALAQAGEELFNHVWTPNDPLAEGGDGLGPVYNAKSCTECHNQGGPGGGGSRQRNVTMFTVQPPGSKEPARQGVVHAFGSGKYQETLRQVHPDLPNLARPRLEKLVALPGSKITPLVLPSGVSLSQRNTPALFGAKLIDEIPDRVLIATERKEHIRWGWSPTRGEKVPVGRALRLADGRVGHFGWKAQTASLADFVQAACANELGLGNPGQPQPAPLSKPDYQPVGLDLTQQQCDQLTAFVGSLPRPEQQLPDDPAERQKARAGKKLFNAVGCADCHTPDLGSVEGIYSDLLLHRMGQQMQGASSYYGPPPPPTPSSSDPNGPPLADEWRTPPLWGVADSAPYMHDGRADTLAEAIRLHEGQAAPASKRFNRLSAAEQTQLIAFLNTLKAPTH